MSIQIDRCLCFQRSFSELKQLAQNHGCKSLQELQAHVEFGKKCQLCHPYVKEMLKTGQSIFNQILTEP